MRVSFRWLCELLPELRADPHEVAERLTNAGLEVEGTEQFGAGLNRVVVAKVVESEPHPQRKKLSLVTVEHGQGERLRVVCGAPNVPPPGGLVVLATVGTTLPAVGITLEAREIGGVPSAGMLCSTTELGLSDAADGILVLPEGTAAPGTPLPEAVAAATDTIFEIGVTPNRADALGHVGVARDVAALYGVTLAPPTASKPKRIAEAELEKLVSVQNESPERCPHYGAAAVLDVTVGPSPLWLQWRLFALGIRSVSNVVDVTNLLLLETGHPMHAFDLDRVAGARIVVRLAQAGEPFTTLDGVARRLDADDLVICDGAGPTALAGVMGGENSEIRADSRRVLLECAYFTPRGIRRTARRHGMQTDSSYRFERGVDWSGIPHVLERAQGLLGELAGGSVVSGAIHARGAEQPIARMTLRSERIDAILGTRVPFNEATAVLERLGLWVEKSDADADTVVVRGASWRPDLKREIDLIEEVARVRGLEQIPTVVPKVAPRVPRSTGRLERSMAAAATELGLSEALCYSFVSPRELELLQAPPPCVSLTNPLTEERSVMRTSLLPGLLDALRRARRRGERSVRLYSIGALFLPPDSSPPSPAADAARPRMAADEKVLPLERPGFAAVLAGLRPGYLQRDELDLYDAKGIALALIARVTGRVAELRPASGTGEAAHLHPRGAADVVVKGVQVGRLGPLHPDVVDHLDLDGPALVIELDLAALETVPTVTPAYRPIPRLPAVTRDLSLEVSEEVPAGSLQSRIAEAAGDLCESVELLDVFTGRPIPEGARSLTFRVVYRDPKAATDPDQARTLTDKEVDARHTQVRAAAEQLGARARV
jgi:phenylalanyl-tRNA synthetase beta chain